jgi:hypothetical protein
VKWAATRPADIGFNFPRDPCDALHAATGYWRNVDRRDFLTLSSAPFAAAHFTGPLTRWLSVPTDPPMARTGGRLVGRADLEELREVSEQARRWDSQFGGGHWRNSMVTECLRLRAVPLLEGTFTEKIGSELFAATAELARVAAWSAVDMGQDGAAQRHFVQALRLARASGDAAVGSYVLATMSLQAYLRGYLTEAVDMAEAAYERAPDAPSRVKAFAKLAQARAHGRAGEARAAAHAIIRCEELVDTADREDNDPAWLAYMNRSRIATDAAEICRDLRDPKGALTWSEQAGEMPADRYTRATGIRLTVIATAHLQTDNLDQGLAVGHQALGILAGLESTRTRDYLRRFITDLQPWAKDPQVVAFVHESRRLLRGAA